MDSVRQPSYLERAHSPPPSHEDQPMRGGHRSQTDSDKIDEIAARTRRLETRLTSFLVQQGVATQAQKATFREDRIQAPSPHVSLKELLEAVPADWEGPIKVFVGDELLCTLDDLCEPDAPPG